MLKLFLKRFKNLIQIDPLVFDKNLDKNREIREFEEYRDNIRGILKEKTSEQIISKKNSKRDINTIVVEKFTDKLVHSTSVMSEESFRGIIKKFTHILNEQEYEYKLVSYLTKENPYEIIGFKLRADIVLYNSYHTGLRCAGYIMNGGCDTELFPYFRNRIISLGKEVYYSSLKNPDTLIENVHEDRKDYEFESFDSLAAQAFYLKTGKGLHTYTDDYEYAEWNHPVIHFNRKETDKNSMKRICPQLYKKFIG